MARCSSAASMFGQHRQKQLEDGKQLASCDIQ